MTARIQSAGRRGVTLALPEGLTAKASVSGAVYRDTGGPVCGDIVEAVPGSPRWRVLSIRERTTVLTRTSPLGRPQVLAANVDRVLVVASVCSPPLRKGFLDRVLASAEHSGLKCAVVLNKADLSRHPEAVSIPEMERIYGQGAGYPVLSVSAVTGMGMDRLSGFIAGQTVVLTGPSGAGKTSIALRLNPSLDLAVGALNAKTSRGRHTTVTARLLHLFHDTWMMDTPGLRAFSVEHIPAGELWLCFPEFRDREQCRYRDCIHETEPGCGVRAALASGSVEACRYESYIKLLGEIREGRQV